MLTNYPLLCIPPSTTIFVLNIETQCAMRGLRDSIPYGFTLTHYRSLRCRSHTSAPKASVVSLPPNTTMHPYIPANSIAC